MSPRRFKFLFFVLILTSLKVSANERISREVLARSAYEAFIPIIYFLSGAEDFKNSLTADEREQLDTLGQELIKRRLILGPSALPGSGNTSQVDPFKLRFSWRNEDFILKEGEPARTAKVTEDVWFNLNILNDPKNSFDFLGLVQLIFHEFGHKIDVQKKNQDAIDRVAAKIKNYLRPYYKVHDVNHDIQASTFILPYLTLSDGGPINFQMEPIILFRSPLAYSQARIRVQDYIFPAVGYMESGAPVQSYRRILIRPQIKHNVQKIDLHLEIQTQHHLIDAPIKFNFLPLLTQPSSVAHQFAVDPLQQVMNFGTDFPLSNLNQGVIDLKPKVMFGSNYYAPSRGRWIEALKVSENHSNRIVLEGKIFYSGPLNELSLSAQAGGVNFEFPVIVSPVAQDIYQIRLEVPRLLPEGTSLEIQTLNLNSSERWELPDSISIDLQLRELTPLKIQWIAIGGKQDWIDIRQLGFAATVEDIRMMFKVRSQSLLRHLEISWMIIENIHAENGRRSAVRSRVVREVIPASQLQQSLENGTLTFTFQSRKMENDFSTTGRRGFLIKDTRHRSILDIGIVTEDLQKITLGNRMAPQMSEWRSTFILPEVLSRQVTPNAENVHERTQCTSLL